MIVFLVNDLYDFSFKLVFVLCKIRLVVLDICRCAYALESSSKVVKTRIHFVVIAEDSVNKMFFNVLESLMFFCGIFGKYNNPIAQLDKLLVAEIDCLFFKLNCALLKFRFFADTKHVVDCVAFVKQHSVFFRVFGTVKSLAVLAFVNCDCFYHIAFILSCK